MRFIACALILLIYGEEREVRPRTGCEGLEGKTVSLAADLDEGRWLTPHPGRFTPGKDIRYPLHRRLGDPVWVSAENLASTGIRFPDRPARSQLLYTLRYPVPQRYVIPIPTNALGCITAFY